jgi:hypothetical protein
MLLGVATLLPRCMEGQAVPGNPPPLFSPTVFATVGGGNTQFPYYADNALGFNVGAFLQPFPLLGVEMRGGTYPIQAKFVQSPVTAGWRVGRRHLNDARWLPFGYIGGGASKAHDSNTNFQPTTATWSACWQASAGLDLATTRFAWRVVEGSWTNTYTERRTLRTPYLSTGLVYYFGR